MKSFNTIVIGFMLITQQTAAKDTTTRGLRTQHNSRLNNKHKQKNNNNDVDIIAKEDVAFFTQISRGLSFPPTPRPTPAPVFPTPRPNPPPTPVPIPIETPNPTGLPPVVSTPAPVPVTPPTPITPAPVPVAGNVPVVNPDSVSLPSGDLVFVPVLNNDIPAPGQSLIVKSVTAASNGDCSIGLDLLDVVYIPDFEFTGTDSCDYEACDAQPECDTATITFEVGLTGIVTKSELDGEVDEVQQTYGNIVPNRSNGSRSSGKSGKRSGKSGKASSGKSSKGSSKSSKGSSRGSGGYSRRQY